MKNLILLALFLLPALVAGIGVDYNFANPTITTDGTYEYFEFDITAVATGDTPPGTTNYTTLYALFAYNTDGFGEYIKGQGNVTVTAGPLVDINYYVITVNDNASNKLAITIDYDSGTFTQLPTTAAVMVHVAIKIADNTEQAGIYFDLPGMSGQSFYRVSAGVYSAYSPVDSQTDLQDETLPVELSSFTAVLSVTNNVMLQWVTQSETNVSGYRLYRNSTNDLESAVMLNTFIEATNTSQMQIYVYWDEEVYEDGTYYYWLQNLDFDGSSAFHGPISITVNVNGAGIPVIPITQGINNAYPNPFNPRTSVEIGLRNQGQVKVAVYNQRGQLVRTLLDDYRDKGSYTLHWDGTDVNNRLLPSGMYVIRMLADGKQYNHKVMLLK